MDNSQFRFFSQSYLRIFTLLASVNGWSCKLDLLFRAVLAFSMRVCQGTYKCLPLLVRGHIVVCRKACHIGIDVGVYGCC